MKRKIRLTYIIDFLDTNLAGTENQLIKMINGVDKKRFEVELILFRDHQWFQATTETLACSKKIFPIADFKNPATYANILKLAKYLGSSKPDVVHTFFPVGNIVGVLASRMAGVKTILSSRRDYGEWMSPKYLFFTKQANRFVTKIVANSKAVAALTSEKEGAPQDKLAVIYNGIDLQVFNGLEKNDALKKKLNIPEGNLVAGIVANFRPMKHHHTFIMAANEVLKKRADVTFILIGKGKLQEEMERLAKEFRIEKSVLFLGSQPVLPYLPIMDAGVNCSEGEGLSNAIMEYMSAGVPCVVSEAGGNTDLIENGVNGYTFAIDDHKALASLLLKLFDDKRARERFIATARKKIEDEMSLKVILSKYEDFYTGLVSAG